MSPLNQIACPHCTRQIRLRDQYLGRTIYCPRCGRQLGIANPSGASTNWSAAYAIVDPSVRYAGFWIRTIAMLIDFFVRIIPVTYATAIIPGLGGWIVYIVYKGFCISGWNGQTVGKKACGIRVVDRNFSNCSIGRAIGRTASEFISSLIIGIGYLMAGFDSRKQALHDRIAETLHIYAR